MAGTIPTSEMKGGEVVETAEELAELGGEVIHHHRLLHIRGASLHHLSISSYLFKSSGPDYIMYYM
jgi:hypothetical protein